MKKLISLINAVFCLLLLPTVVVAGEYNLLPRIPEIVIEKEFSQFFKVTDCVAKANVEGETANTSLKAVLVNIANKEIASSVKFRILYPTAQKNISIKVNGKDFGYDPENPRYSFSLKPQESISFEMKTKVYVKYSVEAVLKAAERKLEAQNGAPIQEKSNGRSLAEDFFAYFKKNERIGKRLEVGMLVSKWGIFPLEIEKLSVEVEVPQNFTLITSVDSAWKLDESKGKSLIYRTNDIENYNDTIFLPKADKAEQLVINNIIKSGQLR